MCYFFIYTQLLSINYLNFRQYTYILSVSSIFLLDLELFLTQWYFVFYYILELIMFYCGCYVSKLSLFYFGTVSDTGICFLLEFGTGFDSMVFIVFLLNIGTDLTVRYFFVLHIGFVLTVQYLFRFFY